MQLGMIGLGRMGGNIVRRLLQHGNTAVVSTATPPRFKSSEATARPKAATCRSSWQSSSSPAPPGSCFPAGGPTEAIIMQLADLMDAGDVIIDGGNSFYKDDIHRAAALKRKNIHYVAVGTSGGVWGLERGYCMMIGGDRQAVERLDPIFSALAPGCGDIGRAAGREGRDPRVEQGYLHAGPSGAGHFVKMIHNGIEYRLMQAYAEGFEILRGANSAELPPELRFELDLAMAEAWRRGSVISSWLLDLAAMALAGDPTLDSFEGYVQDSGEGRWTINATVEEAVPATVLSTSLYACFRSRQDMSFADKMLSAMRKGFGGHVEPKRSKP